MNDKRISFETAKLLKTKVPFYADWLYDKKGELWSVSMTPWMTNKEQKELVPAPTQTSLQKYLREVHNLEVSSHKMWHYSENGPDPMETFYQAAVTNFMIPRTDKYILFISNVGFKTYEEALEVGLQEASKLLKVKKPQKKW